MIGSVKIELGYLVSNPNVSILQCDSRHSTLAIEAGFLNTPGVATPVAVLAYK